MSSEMLPRGDPAAREHLVELTLVQPGPDDQDVSDDLNVLGIVRIVRVGQVRRATRASLAPSVDLRRVRSGNVNPIWPHRDQDHCCLGGASSGDHYHGADLWAQVQASLTASRALRAMKDASAEADWYGDPVLVLPRIGQGAFRAMVQRTLPV